MQTRFREGEEGTARKSCDNQRDTLCIELTPAGEEESGGGGGGVGTQRHNRERGRTHGRTLERHEAEANALSLLPSRPPALTRSLSVGFPHSLITSSSSSSSSSWASFVQSPLLTAIDRTNDLPIILQPVLPLLNVVANNNQQLNELSIGRILGPIIHPTSHHRSGPRG